MCSLLKLTEKENVWITELQRPEKVILRNESESKGDGKIQWIWNKCSICKKTTCHMKHSKQKVDFIISLDKRFSTGSIFQLREKNFKLFIRASHKDYSCIL